MRASRLSRYSWTMFDFANQPFYTLIMTFVFSVYFTDVFITGDDGAQKLTLTQTISGLAIAILSPVLGSIKDIKGNRKLLMGITSILFVIGFQVFNFEPINVSQNSSIISSKLIYIEQSDDLATRILQENGAILVEYPKGKETFVSTILTVINRDRIKKNIDKSGPLILQQKDNGRLSIFDPSSEKEVDLMAFGDDNISVFRDILGQ